MMPPEQIADLVETRYRLKTAAIRKFPYAMVCVTLGVMAISFDLRLIGAGMLGFAFRDILTVIGLEFRAWQIQGALDYDSKP